MNRTSVSAAFPEWLEPMAATLTQDRFAGPDWIFERKFDGIRMIAYRNGDRVRLLSRNRLPLNRWYPAVVDAISRLPVADVILDGEATGAWGTQGAFAYNVFDVLWLNGRSLTSLPLVERRALLRGLPLEPPIGAVPEVTDASPWERACAEGWEGVIAKRRDSFYEHRRSRQWLKMKCELSHEFIIGGFTDPKGSRVGLGALLIGHPENDELAFAGKVGTGFDNATLLDLRARLDDLETDLSPFTKGTGFPRLRMHWVRPVIRVQVGFIEWTAHGKLRHPRLLRVVSDGESDGEAEGTAAT